MTRKKKTNKKQELAMYTFYQQSLSVKYIYEKIFWAKRKTYSTVCL